MIEPPIMEPPELLIDLDEETKVVAMVEAVFLLWLRQHRVESEVQNACRLLFKEDKSCQPGMCTGDQSGVWPGTVRENCNLQKCYLA